MAILLEMGRGEDKRVEQPERLVTTSELAVKLGITREEVLENCLEQGVPVQNSRVNAVAYQDRVRI